MTGLLRRDLLPFLAVTGLLVGLLIGGAAYFGQDLAAPGALAVSAVAAGVLWAARYVRAPDRSPAVAAPVEDAGRRPFRRLTWLRERIDWGGRSAENFRSALVPVLAELADDRLRRGHGVDRSRDPEAARRLLGDDLAAVLAGAPDGRGPNLRELDDYVRRIESL